MRQERPRLGGTPAVIVFIAVLLAFTAQSDLTTYVQRQLEFQKPFFILYVFSVRGNYLPTCLLILRI